MTAVQQISMIAGTSTTQSTASYVVAGAVPPFLAWSGNVPDGATVRYLATDGVDFEEGIGTWTEAGTSLSRITIVKTSLGDTDKVDWGTGTREIRLIDGVHALIRYNDTGYAEMLTGLQWTGATKRYRIYESGNAIFFANATTAPFVHILKHNPASTPIRVETEYTFEAPAYRVAGTAFGDAVTMSKANEAQAQAGAIDTALMTPLRVGDAMKSPTLLIGPLSAASVTTDAAQVVILTAGGALARATLAVVKAAIAAPDFVSTGNAIPGAAGIVTLAHALGAEPARVEWMLRCSTGDAGHAVGDAVDVMTSDSADNQLTVTMGRNATNVWCIVPPTMLARHKASYGSTVITKSSWALEVRAWR